MQKFISCFYIILETYTKCIYNFVALPVCFYLYVKFINVKQCVHANSVMLGKLFFLVGLVFHKRQNFIIF